MLNQNDRTVLKLDTKSVSALKAQEFVFKNQSDFRIATMKIELKGEKFLLNFSWFWGCSRKCELRQP